MKNNQIIILSTLLIAFGVISRLAPHAPNMTAITAIAFITGIYLGGWRSVAFPIAIVFASDFLIGFYDWKIMLSVYGSFAMIGALLWLSKKYSIATRGVAIMSSSLLFFLITNAAVWIFSPWYEKSFAGLLYAYELGIPFLKNMFIGDIVYTTSAVVLIEVVRNRERIVRAVKRALTQTSDVYIT